ncbi:hypothetical protein [Listeria booriae]|uniref:hypothetical protein n=1 Tax=Listeria booriae TaxID=1552123 RepID=UPI0016272775|nr:hypothetical protein [Listeria booriae]MBC2163438.1 hypothetical protein [Listeria booriae]
MTQNEKDRFQLESLRLFMELNETQKILFEIADRLLTERENAGVGYLHDPANFLSYRDQHATCFFNKQESWNGVRGIKGVWIPVEEAE